MSIGTGGMRFVLLAGIVAGCKGTGSLVVHPEEMVGQWVRLKGDRTWGDTLTYLPTGEVLGSTGHPVPREARWWVEKRTDGITYYCAADGHERGCDPGHLKGDSLLLNTDAGTTTFRRVSREP